MAPHTTGISQHDPAKPRFPSAPPPPLPSTALVAGWTIAHGHRPISGTRTISGHHHPVLRLEGLTAPCFLIGRGRIVLPAFSTNAAGVDVVTAGVPAIGSPTSFAASPAPATEPLDFGPLDDLRRLGHRRP